MCMLSNKLFISHKLYVLKINSLTFAGNKQHNVTKSDIEINDVEMQCRIVSFQNVSIT